MDFTLTTEQTAFRDALRDVLAEAAPDTVWDRLAEMGLFGLLVEESAGGLGLSEVDAVPLLELIGYYALAEPVASTLVAAALDPALASGHAHVARQAAIVHYGRDADRLLTLETEPVRLTTVAAATDVATVDATLRAVHASPSAGGELEADVELTRDRLHLATAAQLVGLGRRMLDLTTDYVRTRHQFGVPVGSFQAVSHRCAEMLRGVESTRSTSYFAAWAADADTSRLVEGAALAAASAASVGRDVAASAIQAHGGIGFTWEADVHWLYKRAQIDAALVGGAGRHRRTLAQVAAERVAAPAAA